MMEFISNTCRRALPTALSIAAMLAGAGCGQKQAKAPAAANVPVTVARTTTKNMPLQLNSVGTVEAYSTVQVKSLVAGEITAVHFTQGQDVKKGDLLFTIDKRPFQADLQRSIATLDKDNAQLIAARAQSDRWSKLEKEGVVAREQTETIVANAKALEATVEADQAMVDTSKLNLQYTDIYSPIDGRTGDLMVHAGNLVKANDTPVLVTINQVSPIYVDFTVPQQQLPEVKHYMAQGKLQVQVTPPNTAQPVTGELTFVDNAVDPATSSIKLKGTFENGERKLWPGQFVTTTLTLTVEPNATVIPVDALQNGQNGSFVFVVKADKTAEKRDIQVERTLGREVVVSGGLKPGDIVVTDGQLRIAPGQSKLDYKEVDAGVQPDRTSAQPAASSDRVHSEPRAQARRAAGQAGEGGDKSAKQERGQ